LNSDIRILEVEPYYTYEKAREPLKFGAVVVEGCLYGHVRVRAENRAGQVANGWGSIFLMDLWGWPSPTLPHRDREEAMRQVNLRFCRMAESFGRFAHPIGIFMELEEGLAALRAQVCAEMNLSEAMPTLASLVAISNVDAAIHDAFGKANGISTYDGYGKEHMSHDLGHYLGADYAGRFVGDHMRPAFLPEVPVFHLVGGLDALRESELDPKRVEDGLPSSLERWIERDGLTCLKVKLRGHDLQWDVQRFLDVAAIGRDIQTRQGRHELYLSADTNEQCEHPDYVIEFLEQVRARDTQAYDDLLYIEQPTERELTDHRFDMRKLSQLKPVILDESLMSLADFDLAMELGWSGIALKTCKCQSADLLYVAKAEHLGIPYTVQDLTNPGLALLQSVGLAARTHTLKGVEGNSRQYFPAVSNPEATVHPGIFRLNAGQATTSTLLGPGLGFRTEEISRAIFHQR
jgi:L-alanine-DL-glutamate epimerase-like enolase superfamily enzyme